MTDLDKKFGKERVIDCPISELATTGATVGAAICGYRPMIVHPRVDFMLLAVDQIVTQAAKWRHMFGGNSSAPATFRAIINRGGEQGAQHSQSLHSWFAHIPGLKVVMPYTAKDARDLMISSVLSDDPVMFIDDRWLYEKEEEYTEIDIVDLNKIKPQKLRNGSDVTVVSLSYASLLCEKACETTEKIKGISSDFYDLRILNPLQIDDIIESVNKTGRLLVVDGDWASCGMASEIITSVIEKMNISVMKKAPIRITLPNAPAPTSKVLEDAYYIKTSDIENALIEITK
ncbi:acetoin:2,6-dichlorophenolindophenol oxidoreductase subunit beta [mine drainage metagenome]|uniref:Acetoin:2,6-dichlorophenolindophenol oxidoreductase subunit beta n=1 Tax=mine drainage metagenome TaxID=410659 RepID=A0A1J5SGI5_9ZZZZ